MNVSPMNGFYQVHVWLSFNPVHPVYFNAITEMKATDSPICFYAGYLPQNWLINSKILDQN